uniref:Dynein regulatory complex protein 1 n=1 Tax=Cyprinus carpio TaxID=7962 RepID=A0A8C1U9L2_CYPCA
MQQPEPFAGEEADESGPSIESKNPEERISARRLRIAARNEAKTRQELGEDSQEKEDIKEEIRKSQKEHVTKLQSDGLELVTKIQVAVDARESDRRTELEETDAKMKQTPLDLRDALNSQQQLCEQIVADKNKLTSELQQELKASYDRYVKDLKKQAKDTDLIIERMEEQISSLKTNEHLHYIKWHSHECTLFCERRTLLTKHRKKWEHQMKERSEKELKDMLQGLSLLGEHEDLLQKLKVQKAEEYSTDKIKMDTEVQKLQEVKFNCHLNEEKLDYKYEVVKKREEENALLKSQLKRKIIRMQDFLNTLKSNCANQEKQSKAEEQSLRNDYTRIRQQYKDMQKKARHFAALDAERFEKIWLISEGEVKALVHRTLETDRIIHEQQLGLAWVSLPLPFIERSGPIEHKTLKTASQAAADTLQEETGGDSVKQPEGLEDTASGVNRRTVKGILELMCDELGFLVESKLLKLVSHLEKNEQSLIKLDCIFTAIGIESENDVHKMAEFLMNYRQHEETTNNQSSDFIHHNDLLVALKDFTVQHCRPHDLQASQKSSVLGLDMRDDSEDMAYWECIANVIPESKLRLWSALDTALNKYQAKLLAETQNVQQQNTELRQLLHLYTSSKVTV